MALQPDTQQHIIILSAGAMASLTIWICALLFILSVEYSDATDKAGCDSILRNLFPHLFTHCPDPLPCAYGPWGRWSYTGVVKNDASCNSKQSQQYNRTRIASNITCANQLQPESGIKYECIPCTYGPWGRWFYTGVLKTDSRCESGKVRQYNRTRTASTDSCKSHLQPQSQEKYECKVMILINVFTYQHYFLVTDNKCTLLLFSLGEPTLNQTATLIIENLKLGADAENPPTDPFTSHPSTLAPITLTRPTSRSIGWFRSSRWRAQPPRVVYRPTYCPTTTQQSNNRVCSNIGCANPTGMSCKPRIYGGTP